MTLATDKHPGVIRFYRRAVSQQARFVAGDITKDQLLWNLRAMAEKTGVFAWVDWSIWEVNGYTVPWNRTCEAAGTPGITAKQGGAR